MNGPACGSCGAGNPADAAFCWRCYQRFGAGGSARPTGGMTPSVAIGVSPVAAASGAIGGIARATSSFASPTRDPYAGKTSKGLPEGLVPKVLLLAILAAGAWFGYTKFFGGVAMPDEIGGMARVEGPQAEELDRLLETEAGSRKTKAWGAAYGDPAAPAYVLIVVRGVGADETRRIYQGGETGGSLPGSLPEEELSDGVACATSVGGSQTACAWPEGDHGVLLAGIGVSPIDLQFRVAEVRRALDL